ncbi:MFS transporter [Altererythrobacter sp. ZODW24]|uniref:MFS transporter n=1 Tax=Altererythrobacter sp. ZODW24 TaxID=2185142 RepID=UPI0013B43EB5|nr:MFS transporter [Altererythrobacter sp. ZODW24]
MILEKSAKLRLLTVFLFYFTQGIPVGLFFYAIPAWLATNGASTAAIAGVVSASILPWTLKFVVGFVMDRYTYLPMGRRRIWIIGAQFTIVAMLLFAAILSPGPNDIWLLSILGFLANSGTAFQDVSIDGLAVDIMPEDERAKASGIMFGGQILGISATTFAAGQLIAKYGTVAGYLAAAAAVSCILIFGILMKEREGEGRFPWSGGQAHPRNVALQVEAWKPLLVGSFKAMIAPLSLAAMVIFLLRSMPAGMGEAYHPGLATGIGGWSQTDYTNTISSAQFAVGIFALVVGGWAVAKIGAQRAALIMCALVAITALGFGLSREYWDNAALLTAYFWQLEFFVLMLAVAFIPIAMRLCDPRVAATQFTLYMAASNVGRPIGSSIAAATDTMGSPQLMYFTLAGVFAVFVLILIFVRFPTKAPEAEAVIKAADPEVADQPPPVLN